MNTSPMIFAAFLAILLAGCGHSGGDLSFDGMHPSSTTTEVTAGHDAPDINEARAEAYDGPKARIAVARFVDKTGSADKPGDGWWSHAIGDGMADQLVTALFNTNRFIVLERQTLEDVLAEQDLAVDGRVRQDTAAPIGEIEGAELLITAAVTEFEGDAGGNTATTGGGYLGRGLVNSLLGKVASGVSKARMAIDLRIVDTRTSRVVAATSVESDSADVDLSGALGLVSGGGGALADALSSWENTPAEKAFRGCIKQAVEFITAKTPPVYHRYPEAET